MQETQERTVQSLGWEDPLRQEWQPTPVFLLGKSHGQRSLVGHSPQDHKELDVMEVTEHTVRLFILSPLLFTSVIS